MNPILQIGHLYWSQYIFLYIFPLSLFMISDAISVICQISYTRMISKWYIYKIVTFFTPIWAHCIYCKIFVTMTLIFGNYSFLINYAIMYVVHWLDAQCSKNHKIVKYNWVLNNYFKTSNKINKASFAIFYFKIRNSCFGRVPET